MKSGTIGGLLVGGFLLKTVGWRVIIFSVGIYGGIYMYERMTWTNQAKCKEFKKQYVDHAARKLRLVVDMTSANCSHQVHKTGITYIFLQKKIVKSLFTLKKIVNCAITNFFHVPENSEKSSPGLIKICEYIVISQIIFLSTSIIIGTTRIILNFCQTLSFGG